MKVAVLFSNKVKDLDIEKYLPDECEEIIIGGECGFDGRVSSYAIDNGKSLQLRLPVSKMVKMESVIEDADYVVAFTKRPRRKLKSLCKNSGKGYSEIIIE